MTIKDIIKKILKKCGLFEKIKYLKKENEKRKKLTKKYIFENKMKNQDKLCIILAGYKDYLWDIVFKRIKTFIPEDIDVCILSSGKYIEELSNIAKENNWSYLSTKRNNVSLIQNVAIKQFKNAKYIYKIDEDMFITKNFFQTLMKTYNDCTKNGEYRVGFVAPTIPINGFGNLLVLKRFNLVEKYEELFEKPIYATGRDLMIETNIKTNEFIWGSDNFLPNIDKMNDIVQDDKFEYVACPIRFSIGAILFTRKLWEDMEMFDVPSGLGMGNDEEKLCKYCICNSKAIIVSKNTIVGHLAFKMLNEKMKDYFNKNKNIFEIHN